MAGKIWRYDCYDLRKFKPGDINVFIDIGANVGTTSLQAKVLNPTARIISFEPVKEIFDILMINMKQWMKTGIECYNIALGDGTDMCFVKGHGSGMHRFCTEKEKQWWPKEEKMTPSKTFVNIFKDYNISRSEPYIIKLDCEGGERFFLQQEQEETVDIIRGSVQTMFEIHLPFGGTGEQWKEWFKKLSDTHELRIGEWVDKDKDSRRYRYVPCEEFSFTKGTKEVELVNRDWVGPWPGKGM